MFHIFHHFHMKNMKNLEMSTKMVVILDLEQLQTDRKIRGLIELVVLAVARISSIFYNLVSTDKCETDFRSEKPHFIENVNMKMTYKVELDSCGKLQSCKKQFKAII